MKSLDTREQETVFGHCSPRRPNLASVIPSCSSSPPSPHPANSLARPDQPRLQLPSCNWVKVLAYLGPSCRGLLQSWWGRLRGYFWALVVYSEAWGSPLVMRKTVTKAGQPRAESAALESRATRPHVPLWKKESNNKFKSLDFKLQHSNQPISFQGKTLSYVFAVSSPTEREWMVKIKSSVTVTSLHWVDSMHLRNVI